MYVDLRVKSLLFSSNFNQHLNRPCPGILEKIPKVKFHKKLSTGSRVIPSRHTDRQAWGVKHSLLDMRRLLKRIYYLWTTLVRNCEMDRLDWPIS